MARFIKYASLIALVCSLGVFSGCGEKKPPQAGGDQVVDYGNPKENFRLGVELLNVSVAAGKGDYAKAYTYFDNATKADPSFAKAHYNAGYCASRLGRTEEAEGHFRDALKLEPDYTPALLSLAGVLSLRGKDDEAIALYKDYVAQHATDLEVRNNLVDTLTRAKRYDDALTECQEVLAHDKKNVNAYNSLSRIYFEQGKYEMSLLAAEKAKTLNEGDPGIYNAMGVTYLKLGKEPSAIEQFKTAIKLAPAHRDANMNLGWLALNSGDYGLALRCFQSVTSQYPGDVDGLLGLSVAQRGSKDLEGAAKTYEQILKLDASNETAYFNAATLHEKYTKDYKRALKYLQDYANMMQGKIGPQHEVYARMERVRKSEEAETARKAEEERQKAEAQRRKELQEKQLSELKGRLKQLKGWLDKYGSCPALVASGGLEMGMTVAEQAQTVVDANDSALAGDMMTFFDQVEPEIQAAIAACDAAVPAPPPEEKAPETPAAPPAETPAAPPAETPAAPPAETPAAPPAETPAAPPAETPAAPPAETPAAPPANP